MSPCSKSTRLHLIQVPRLHRGHHAMFPPFFHPSPSIFSIFLHLFPPCSIIAVPSLPPHHPSPHAALVRSSLSFPFPFLFFFFSPCPPLLHLSPVPSSPIRRAPPFCFHLLSFVVFFFFFLFFFFLQSRPTDHPPSSVTSSRSPPYQYHSRHTSEMQNKGNAT
jgi:hypothetical protein